ncbi:MAG: hypothetical protein MPF33_10090 [Candidatus Aramenus sp.]|jgi:hypothetical protein|nr:hypothetical protein [Candidatus Aramenus sp.]
MLVAVPRVIRETVDDLEVYISVMPCMTEGEVVEKLKKAMTLTSLDEVKYYPYLFGGIIVLRGNSVLVRYEFDGFVKVESVRNKYHKFKVAPEIQGCYQFDNEAVCFFKDRCDGCLPVDNIGLRFIV